MIQSIKMVPSGIKIGKEQLNVLAYADDIVLIGKSEIDIRQHFVEIENIVRKLGLNINQGKTKYIIVEWKNSSKQNKKGQLTIRSYTLKRVEYFKYLGVILNEDNNHQIDLQEKIKKCQQNILHGINIFYKNIPKKLKLRLRNTIIDKTLTYASEI